MQSEQSNAPIAWRSRGYIPHFDLGAIPQLVTFRLDDSLPQCKLKQYREELLHHAELNIPMDDDAKWVRLDDYLDKGLGECWLSQPEIAQIVQKAILWFHKQKYELHAWVVMPNHVHVVFSPINSIPLHNIVHSWKSYTANQANKILCRTGVFWQREYFDRYIRTEEHFATAIFYVEMNPVKAGLCTDPKLWPFSSARFR